MNRGELSATASSGARSRSTDRLSRGGRPERMAVDFMTASISLAIVRLDLVKSAFVIEVRFLGLLPAAKHFVDREQGQLGKLVLVFLCDLLRTRAVKVFRGNLLPLR